MNGLNYTKFPLRKKSGGIRWIYTPTAELKRVQHKINEKILNHPTNLERISFCATAYKKGASPVLNAKIHANSSNLMVIDLKDFFPNISINMVRSQFMRLLKAMVKNKIIDSYEFSDVNRLAHLCCYNNGLVQGAPTSPQLSNYVMANADKKIYNYVKSLGLRYSRYSDDIIVSVSKFMSAKKLNLSAVYNTIAHTLSIGGFSINHKKVRLLCSNRQLRVTGIVVNDRPNLDRKSYKILRAKVHNSVKLIENGMPLSKTFTMELKGEIGWLISINKKKGYELLDKLTNAKNKINGLI